MTVTNLHADVHARERALTGNSAPYRLDEKNWYTARQALQTEVQRYDLFDIGEDGQGLKRTAWGVHAQVIAIRERRSRLEAEIAEQERRCAEKEQEEEKLRAAETESRLAAELHKLLGAEFTDFLSQEAVEVLMRDATFICNDSRMVVILSISTINAGRSNC